MMLSLGDILKNTSRKTPLMKGVIAAGAVEIANIFLEKKWGENVKKMAKAMYLKNGTLFIACLSSILAQEIKLNEQNLITEINKKCGYNTVQKIRYLA